MPEKETLERAEEDKREGKAPSTQAGEFVKEEMDHIREGKHGAASTKQAIAIGLSKARRSGVDLPPPKKGTHIGEDAQVGGERLPQGTKQRAQEEAVAQTFTSDGKCSEAAAAEGGVEEGALTAGETGGQSSWKRGAQEGCTKSSAHERCGGTETGGEEGGSNADEAGGVGTFVESHLCQKKAEMGHPRIVVILKKPNIVESHLCQKKAEMGHPRIVVILTKPNVVESYPSQQRARMGHPRIVVILNDPISPQKQNGSLVGEPF